MGIFFVLGGLDPKGQNFTSEQISISMEARGRGKLRLLSNAFVKELGISFLFLFPRDTMTVCLYVCLFFFVRAGRFKRPLGGDQGGIPITVCFFAYRSFIIFGSARFGLHTTVLVKGLSCFIMMESCANLVFLFPFVDIV